nr:hypothetical protein [Tanacetum cinerariifolium]
MTLAFAGTHNMIAYLTKLDTSEGFEQILDFLNASMIQYALTLNPTIYVSCIKQFWSSVSIKKTNDVVHLQSLIDRRKVVITEDTVRQALRLDDAKSIDCLPNAKIFVELERMGYEKPSTKLTFYKVFFSTQLKFLIHTILQCMSAKRTAWNEFSSSMASAVICLATGRKFNFSKYIFDSLVKNMDSSSKFYMYPRFLQLMLNAQVGDLSSHTTKYTSPALTQKATDDVTNVVADDVVADVVVDANVAPTLPTSPIAQPSSPPQQQQPSHDAEILIDLLNTLLETCTTLTRKRLKKVGTTQRVESSSDTVMDDQEDASKQEEIIAIIDADEDVILEVNAEKDDDEPEPTGLKEMIEVVTTVKLMIKVVTATATTITTALSAAKRRKEVVIRDPKETATPSTIVHFEPKYKDKEKGILVEEPKPLKKQAQIEQDEAYARELEAELNKNINWDDVIEQVKRKEKEDNAILRYQALKRKPQTEAQARKNMIVYLKNMAGFNMDFFKEETSKALKRKSESSEQQAVKKQKFDEEIEELKKHIQIIPNNEDDVYTEATPLALKVPVVDYQIHTENNKPYYKVISADGTHQLFLSFLNLLRNFDGEDLEMLWQIVQERFASLKPKNFSDDFLLNTLKAMFEKPNVEAHIWKNQRRIHGLAKVKSWKLLESYGVHIITFTTTQMVLLVERRYHLTRFTLDQMLNNVRLEVEEESEVSLELLRFLRRQQQEGYRLDFGVDVVEDFKEYTLRDYYCWLKTYYCRYKLKLLDNAADSRLRLLEQSAAADDKMKK